MIKNKYFLLIAAFVIFTLLTPQPLTARQEEPQQADIINMSFPSKLPFFIDPMQLSGRGGVFSDDFEIKNNNEFDVIVTMENLRYEITADGDKGIELWIEHAGLMEDIAITEEEKLNAAEYYLTPGESIIFSISGKVGDPFEEWRQDDVSIFASYSVIRAVPLPLIDDLLNTSGAALGEEPNANEEQDDQSVSEEPE